MKNAKQNIADETYGIVTGAGFTRCLGRHNPNPVPLTTFGVGSQLNVMLFGWHELRIETGTPPLSQNYVCVQPEMVDCGPDLPLKRIREPR